MVVGLACAQRNIGTWKIGKKRPTEFAHKPRDPRLGAQYTLRGPRPTHAGPGRSPLGVGRVRSVPTSRLASRMKTVDTALSCLVPSTSISSSGLLRCGLCALGAHARALQEPPRPPQVCACVSSCACLRACPCCAASTRTAYLHGQAHHKLRARDHAPAGEMRERECPLCPHMRARATATHEPQQQSTRATARFLS